MGYDMTIQHDGHLKGDKEYFRLNIFGMSRYRSLMEELGMVYDGGRGIEENEWPEWDAEEAAKDEDAYEFQHAVKVRPLLTRHPEGGDTIPAHKLGSNDGWYVTSDECYAALARWELVKDDALARMKASRERVDAMSEADQEAFYQAHSWGRENRGSMLDLGTVEVDYWQEWIAYLLLAAQHEGFRVF